MAKLDDIVAKLALKMRGLPLPPVTITIAPDSFALLFKKLDLILDALQYANERHERSIKAVEQFIAEKKQNELLRPSYMWPMKYKTFTPPSQPTEAKITHAEEDKKK